MLGHKKPDCKGFWHRKDGLIRCWECKASYGATELNLAEAKKQNDVLREKGIEPPRTGRGYAEAR